MKAKCPECKGKPECQKCGDTGFIDVEIATGLLFFEECSNCGESLGGCVVGGESPLTEPPSSRTCCFCKQGETFWVSVDAG